MPSPQRVRTRGPARPRNLAAGCLAVLVVLAALWMLGRFLRTAGPEATAPPSGAPPPAASESPVPAP